MAEAFSIGDIVRYAGGVSAIVKLVAVHAGGWHAEHVMGGIQFVSHRPGQWLQKASEEDLAFARTKRPEWFTPIAKNMISLELAIRKLDAANKTLEEIESEATRYAEMYESGTDGRNTFIIFRDMISVKRAALEKGE